MAQYNVVINGTSIPQTYIIKGKVNDSFAESVNDFTLELKPSVKSILPFELQAMMTVTIDEDYTYPSLMRSMDGYILKVTEAVDKITIMGGDQLLKATFGLIQKVYLAATDPTAGIISNIVGDLFTDCGISWDSTTVVDSTSTQGGSILSTFECRDTDHLERLNALADSIGWAINYDSATNKGYFTPKAYTLNTNTIYIGGTNNNVVEAPKWDSDGRDFFNYLKIEGALDLYDQPPQIFSGNGSTTAFTLSGKNAEYVKVEYDSSGGTNYTTKTGGKAGSSTTYDYTFDSNTNTVTFTSAPNSGTNNIRITPTVGEPTPVELEDTESQAKYGITVKKKLTFTDCKSAADCEFRGDKLLQVYKDEFINTSIKIKPESIQSLNIKAGQRITVVDALNTKIGTREVAIRAVARNYPANYCELEVGDKDFKILDIDFDKQIRIKRLEEQLAGSQDLITVLKRQSIELEPAVSQMFSESRYLCDTPHTNHPYNGQSNKGQVLDSFETSALSNWTGSGTSLSEYSSTPSLLTNNTVYWKCSEGTGTSVADSIGANTATLRTSSWNTGIVDNALSFTGTGTNRAQVAAASAINNIWTGASGATVSVWVKPTNSNSGNNRIINKSRGNNGWLLLINTETSGSSKLVFQLQTGSGNYWYWSTTNTVIPNGSWSHIVVTFDGLNASTPTIYVNGTSVTLTVVNHTGTTLATDASQAMNIGNNDDADSNGRPFNGLIDEIGIWSRMITGAEVLSLYNSGLANQYPYTNPIPIIHLLKMLSAFWSSTGSKTITTTQSFGDLSSFVGVSSGTPSKGTMGIWLYTAAAADVSALSIRIGSSATDYKEYNAKAYNSSVNYDDLTFTLSTGKNYLLFDLNNPDATSGTTDWTAVDYVQIRFTAAAALSICYFDLFSISDSDYVAACPTVTSEDQRTILRTSLTSNY